MYLIHLSEMDPSDLHTALGKPNATYELNYDQWNVHGLEPLCLLSYNDFIKINIKKLCNLLSLTLLACLYINLINLHFQEKLVTGKIICLLKLLDSWTIW